MEINIEEQAFINSNNLALERDVESLFHIDASSGIQGQLLKLEKSNSIDANQALCILQGRLACIGEEWDYAEFKAEHWANVFNPPQEYSVYLLKSLEATSPQLFIEKLSQFKEHFLSKEKDSSNLRLASYFGSYAFNGENVADYLNQVQVSKSIADLKVNAVDPSKILKVFSNRDLWNWQLWFVETESAYFLFEDIIIS